MRTALFTGSFNPFTIGHASIVERGLNIFDRIIVAVGININKPQATAAAEANSRKLAALYAGEPRVEVATFTGAAVEAARRYGACALLRGVRTVADFEYERTMADVNRRISGIDTVLLFALPEHESVSSSMIRELERFGIDTSQFVPSRKK